MSHLILDQGATWVRLWTWYNPDMTPIDLTGCKATLQIRLGGPDAAVGIDIDSATVGGIVLGGVAGTITATVSAAASAALVLTGVPFGTGEEAQADGSIRRANGALCSWGLEIVMADHSVVRLDGGRMVITREVVR